MFRHYPLHLRIGVVRASASVEVMLQGLADERAQERGIQGSRSCSLCGASGLQGQQLQPLKPPKAKDSWGSSRYSRYRAVLYVLKTQVQSGTDKTSYVTCK